MKKVVAVVALIILFFFIYFLQVNFFNWFTIAGVKPNLFVIYVLIIGLFAGKKIGAPCGFLIGLYIDIINGKFVGVSSLMLALIGFLAQYMYKNVSNDNKFTLILIVAVNTLIYEVGYYFVSVWKLSIAFEFLPFLKIICIEVFYNIMLTIILYPIIQRLGGYLFDTFNKKSFFRMEF